MDRELIKSQLPFTISAIDVEGFEEKYSGKVRDCFVRGSRRILVTTDRLSAFDKVLTTIPFKGQLISQMANFWFDATKHIVPNHIISVPHPNVLVTKEVEILPIELVVRGYLAGSAWRDYQAGNPISGITLPKGMKRSQRFDTPLITPSTKAPKGEHDLPIASDEVVRSGIVEKSVWDRVCSAALELFEFGTKTAAERGLILVDTKYEFGVVRSGSVAEIVLADEIHTQDSSRFWIKDTYQAAFDEGAEPPMLDKEFVRRWLIDKGYMGNGPAPAFPDDFRVDIAVKYIDAYEKITGKKFEPLTGSREGEIKRIVKELLG